MIQVVVALAVVVALLVAWVATRPATFSLSRSVSVAAPAAAVYAHVADLHRWTAWSPWEGLDASLSRSYSGSAAGVGAAYEWQGNAKVGAGRMTIVDAREPAFVEIRLEFIRPWRATNRTTFSLRDVGGETEVTWSMSGANTTMGKLMSLAVSMDRMVGGDFERGLAKLAAVAEGR